MYSNYQSAPYYNYNNYYDGAYQNEISNQYVLDSSNYGNEQYYLSQSQYDAMRQVNRRDYGKTPFVFDIEDATEHNNNFRRAIWTGNHLQLTLMSLNPGEDIGLEVHPRTDQFLRIEDGRGVVQMGTSRQNLSFQRRVGSDDAILVPAGMWHNVVNTGTKPLKLYSIYAPPEHPFGTVHRTKRDAISSDGHHHHRQF